MDICKKCIVTGLVQGVFFRASTQKEARSRNISGWAKNLSDGTVEVVACGTSADVETLCAWLWKGPEYSNVISVECDEFDQVQLTDEQLEIFITG